MTSDAALYENDRSAWIENFRFKIHTALGFSFALVPLGILATYIIGFDYGYMAREAVKTDMKYFFLVWGIAFILILLLAIPLAYIRRESKYNDVNLHVSAAMFVILLVFTLIFTSLPVITVSPIPINYFSSL